MPRKTKEETLFDKLKTILASVIAVLLALVLAASALITYGRELNLPFSVPTWKQVFAFFDLAPDYNAFRHSLDVYFIDVGQGDCTLIVCGENAVLIDGGERSESDNILEYLYELKIDKLDCVVATHPHSDHIGGLIKVLEKIEVSNVLMPRLTEENIPTTQVYADFLEAVTASGAKVYAAAPGDEYFYGGIALNVLAPNTEGRSLNNMSVVLKMEYMGVSFLFMGDAENESENEILSLDYDIAADVIKAGHHGSSSSSGEYFIRKVDPSYAVISCKAGNSYGHPHREVLTLFDTLGITVYRTDVHGDIIFGVDEEGLSIKLKNDK